MLLQNLRGKALTAAITVTSGSGFMLFGYDQGVFSGILSVPSFVETFNHPSSTIQGHVVSSYDLGCVIGALLSIFIGDRLGRKKCIALACCIILIGATLQASSYSLAQMIVARIITGVGTGINTTAIPVWQSETSKPSQRGKLIVLQLVLLICGLVTTNLLNFGLTYMNPTREFVWRFPLAFQCLFALLTMVLLSCAPESPRWLVLKKRPEEAHAIIASLLAKPYDDEEVVSNLKSIVDSVQYEQELNRPGLKEFFHGGRQQNFRRLLLGAGVSFMQQIGGTNVIAYYMPVVLQTSFGFSSRMALILSVVDFISFGIWALVGAWAIDRVGRKRLLMIGSFGQSLCFGMAAMGLSFGTKSMGAFAVSFIFIFYIFQGISFLSIPFIYPSEINSQRMRNSGASIAMTVQWLFVYVVVLITPLGISNLGWRFYLIFCALNISFVPIIWIFYIETAGLSLEQIDRIFEVKYECDSHISYSEATRIVHEEGDRIPVTEKRAVGVEIEHVNNELSTAM